MTVDFDAADIRHTIFALRLLLSALPCNNVAFDAIVAEVNDCPECWKGIATSQTIDAAYYMAQHLGEDAAVARVQAMLANCLDRDDTA